MNLLSPDRHRPAALRHTFFLLVRFAVFCLLLGNIPGCARYVRTARLDFVEMGVEGILQRASDQAGSVSSLLATGTLQIRMERGGLTVQYAILYAEPDSIRLDVSAALGMTIIQAVMAGPAIQVYVPMERAVVVGSVEPGEVLEFGGIPMELASLKELVLGPAIARNWVELAATVDQLDIGPDEIVIGVPRPGGFRLLLTLGTDLHYRSVALFDSEGRVVQESRFADYRRIRGAYLPRVVRLRYPDRFLEMTFEAARRKVKPDRSPHDFVLDLPAGVRRLSLIPPLFCTPGL